MSRPFNIDFLKELQGFQDKFCEYFGVAALLFDDSGDMITQPSNFSSFCKLIRSSEKGLKLCSDSKKNLFDKIADGEPCNYKCAIFDELADAIVPVMWDGKVVAAWGVGQRPIMPFSRDVIEKCAADIDIDGTELWEKSQEFEMGTQEEFNKAIYFLNDIATMIMRIHKDDIELRDNLDRFATMTELTAHDMQESLTTISEFVKLLEDRYGGTGSKEFNSFISYIGIYSGKLKRTAKLLMRECKER